LAIISPVLTKKTIWTIVLSVCTFTATYLYYIKIERARSIKKYFAQPQPGDVYIIRKETAEEGVYVYYLKISGIDEQSINFYRSRLTMSAPYDVLLEQFDKTRTESYTKAELSAIIAGKWMNAYKENTQVLEIERK